MLRYKAIERTLMAGISLITVLEIFSNPHDLEVSIRQVEGKYCLLINRGPGHRFKTLISSLPFADSKEEVIVVVESILESIRVKARSELGDYNGFLSAILNPDGKTIDESKVLTPEIIQFIAKELNERNIASTHAMIPVAVMAAQATRCRPKVRKSAKRR